MKDPDKQLQELFDLVPVGLYMTAPSGEIIDVNPALVDILRYPDKETLLKERASSVFVNKQNRQKWIEEMEQSEATVVIEYQWNRFDGGILWVRDSARAIRDKNDKVLHYIGAIEDITKQKLAEEVLKEYTDNLEIIVDERTRELREAQEELLRKERLAVLGKLSGGIGHDLRTPLGAIKNAVYFLNMAVEKPEPEVKEMLEIIQKEIAISDGIITGLLDFARPKVSKKQKVNVSGLLQEAMSRMQVPENIEVETILNEKLPHILADPVQIGQIFANIIQNGFQAMPDGGRFVIESKAVESDQVMISFSDTGIGISQENLKKLFEPLFSTKPSGTGLGLALVGMLVKEHGGTIEVKSKECEGSTFTIIFPTGK